MLGRALIWPELIGENLPWPATPLNARFVAALYLMGAVSALLCAVSPRYAGVRVTLIEVGVLTGGLLLVTLPRLSEFSADMLPTRWLVFYTVDPVLAGLAWWGLRRREPPPLGRRPLAGVAVAYSGMLAAAGAVMLVAPGFAVQVWPWALTTALAQVY